MSKLDAFKEKLSSLKTQASEKADKIEFVRKLKEKLAARSANASSKPPDPTSLSAIYKEGTTLTRAQVLLFLVLAVISIVSAGSLAKKILVKLKTSSEHEKIKAEYSHELSELKRKSEEKAELVALGQFSANAWVGPPRNEALMSVDLWVRVSDTKAAALVEDQSSIFHDRAAEAFYSLYKEQVNLLTEEGKAKAREKLKASLTKAMPHGSAVEEVFIHNLIVQ